VEIDDTPGTLRLRTKFLDIAIQKHGVLLRVRRADGVPLMTDLSEPEPAAGGVTWDRQAAPGEEFYGEGYDDSDRRIPDIAKARRLLGWEPVWSVRDTIEATMRYHVAEHLERLAAGAGS